MTHLADDFLNSHYPDDWCRKPLPDSSQFSIDPAKLDDLVDNLQLFIADVVAAILDAGSEREAVMENEELRAALTSELRGWTEP